MKQWQIQWNLQRFNAHGKDTVLVAVLGIFLHSLQVLLVTLETPGVVCELRDSVAVT